MVDNPLNHKIEFIKGVGPNKAAALKKELGTVSYTHLRAHETN